METTPSLHDFKNTLLIIITYLDEKM